MCAMESSSTLVAKELSWLSFNERVLQEAEDLTTPLIERIRFLGIFSNNLDEFFRVRVADVRRIAAFSYGQKKQEADELLGSIRHKVLSLQIQFDKILQAIIKELEQHNIFMVNEKELSPEQAAFVVKYFKTHVLDNLSPVLVDDKLALPEFHDYAIYFAIKILHAEGFYYALAEIPTEENSRYVLIPNAGRAKSSIIIVDNIIRYCLPLLFDGTLEFNSVEAYTFKVTRAAELELGDGITQSMLDKVSSSLKKRQNADPVRMIYDQSMPADLLEFLVRKFKLSTYDSIIAGGRYHNSKDFISFPNVGPKSLEFRPVSPLISHAFEHAKTPFDAIRVEDILLYYPYHNFNYLVEFIRTAAIDPKVKSIKMSLYRVAENSKIISSLINAARNHKEVTVVVELTARFDEQANIEWARQLQDARVNVIFSVAGLKVHSKLILIGRHENNRIRYYTHIGSGNFNEESARFYTDLSLFTYDQEIGHEVEQVFDYIRYPYKQYDYKHLLVSPVNFRKSFRALIQREIENAKAGNFAAIEIKCNNLVDTEIVSLLDGASRQGVKVKLIVRGMCTLAPRNELPETIPTKNNLQITSIVDRYLEHARVYTFHNNGNPLYYMGSTDLMTRNLDYRVEVITPINSAACKSMLQTIFDLQWSDNVKARVIDALQANTYHSTYHGTRAKKKARSQETIRRYLTRKETTNLLKKNGQENGKGP